MQRRLYGSRITMETMNKLKVAVIMGSDSDWPVMSAAADVLGEAGVDVVAEVVSAHRTPERMVEFAKSSREAGYSVIIAGAGGAAHLPGMVASLTSLPVIGVPIPLSQLDGLDSLFSIVQMPSGVPVATVGIGQGKNAGLLALRFLSLADKKIESFLRSFSKELEVEVLSKKIDV